MLTALAKNDVVLNLAEPWDRKELERLRAIDQFRCQVCHEQVLMKLGTKRVWHFSHLKGSMCSYEFEPESMYHIIGKKQLFRWFNEHLDKVELEKFLPQLKQRPDLLLSGEKPPIAIEYQCSTIPNEAIQKRTSSFQNKGIKPIWILGEKRISHISGPTYRLDDLAFQAFQFPESNQSRPLIIYYCPLTTSFSILHSIIPYTSRTFFATRENFSLKDFLFPFNPQYPSVIPSFYITSWINKVLKTRLYLHVNRDDAVRLMKHKMLEMGIAPSLFPVEAGVPSNFMFWFETPAYVWQSILLIELLHPMPIGTSFQFRDVYPPFIQIMKRYRIKVRNNVPSNESHFSFAIMDYLKWLRKSGLLKWGGRGFFIKQREIQYPKTVSEAKVRLQEMILLCNEGL